VNEEQYFEALASLPNFRSANVTDLEIKRESKGFRFRGHAAVFDEEAFIDDIPGIGTITESIQPGAFDDVLRRADNIPFNFEHSDTQVYATTGSGLLKLQQDSKGLAVDASLPPTSAAKDLHELVNAGVVDGMSFGFVLGPIKNQQVERRSNGRHRRLLGFKKLLDVCATWNPTYRSAEAEFRSQAMKYVDSPELWQQVVRGSYQQPDDGATIDEPAPDPDPDEEKGEDEASASRAIETVEFRSVEQRKRALQFLVLTTGGITDET
jgi:HK97 family phage prohead protease